MCAVAIGINWAIAFMAFAEWLETLHILGKEFWDLFEVVFLKLGWTRSVLRVQVGMKMGAIKSTTCHGMNLAMEQAANNSSHAMGWTKRFGTTWNERRVSCDQCFSVLSGERCSKVGMKNPPLDKASKKIYVLGFCATSLLSLLIHVLESLWCKQLTLWLLIHCKPLNRSERNKDL